MRRCRSPVCDSLEEQSSGSGHRETFEVSSSNLWLRADLPHEGPGNHSVLVNLDAGARSAAHRHDMHQRPHGKKTSEKLSGESEENKYLGDPGVGSFVNILYFPP